MSEQTTIVAEARLESILNGAVSQGLLALEAEEAPLAASTLLLSHVSGIIRQKHGAEVQAKALALAHADLLAKGAVVTGEAARDALLAMIESERKAYCRWQRRNWLLIFALGVVASAVGVVGAFYLLAEVL